MYLLFLYLIFTSPLTTQVFLYVLKHKELLLFSSVVQLRLTLGHPVDWLPCPSPTSGVYSNSCPLSQWRHPAISSSVIPFSSHLQSFPESGSFPVSQLFTSDGQSSGASALASVLPMDIQDWFPLGWTSLISLQSRGFSRVFSSATIWRHQFFGVQPFLL